MSHPKSMVELTNRTPMNHCGLELMPAAADPFGFNRNTAAYVAVMQNGTSVPMTNPALSGSRNGGAVRLLPGMTQSPGTALALQGFQHRKRVGAVLGER